MQIHKTYTKHTENIHKTYKKHTQNIHKSDKTYTKHPKKHTQNIHKTSIKHTHSCRFPRYKYKRLMFLYEHTNIQFRKIWRTLSLLQDLWLWMRCQYLGFIPVIHYFMVRYCYFITSSTLCRSKFLSKYI